MAITAMKMAVDERGPRRRPKGMALLLVEL
jgi:hypothetical protein